MKLAAGKEPVLAHPPTLDPAAFHRDRLDVFDRSWRTRRLASGLTVLHIPLPGSDRFFIGAMIKAGSRLEAGEHPKGVSHFLEHMMFRGSGRYPEFAKLAEAFESLGGDWNAATGQEHTEYWYSGICHTARPVMELFTDFLESPQFTDLEVERNIILRELDGETNDHGHSTDLDHHVAELLWPGSTLAQPILGTPESLARIDLKALRRYRDQFYVPQNMSLCLVGGEDSMLAELAVLAGNLRGSFAAAPRAAFAPLPAFKGPAVKWIEHSDNEYEIKLSFLVEGEFSPQAPVYDLIARMLADGFASRLARRLREELGLVYDLSAHATLGLDGGTIDIHATCAQDGLDEFLNELLALLRAFVQGGPSAAELRRAVIRAVVDGELSPTIPEVIGSRLAWAEVAGQPLKLAMERERLKALTVEDVAKVARRHLRLECAALAVMGPAADESDGQGRQMSNRLLDLLKRGLS